MCIVWHSGRGICVECYMIRVREYFSSSVYECQSVECVYINCDFLVWYVGDVLYAVCYVCICGVDGVMLWCVLVLCLCWLW